MRGSKKWIEVLLVAVPLIILPSAAEEPSTGTIRGSVLDREEQPVLDATVSLVQLRRRARLEKDGTFLFEEVRPGFYLIEVVSRGQGSAVKEVQVLAGDVAEVSITLDLARHRERVVVSASAQAQGLLTTYEPVEVLDREELASKVQMSLGETLSAEPGVASTSFGAGASRPVIRGLGENNIRILDGGVGVGDASAASPDHALSIDPISAETIEVIRGPASLLYGSTAVGGLVNIIDNRIPSYIPEKKVTGSLDLRAGNAAGEETGAVVLNGHGGPIAWHLDGLVRRTEDYEIPGSGNIDGSGPFGTQTNSFVESEGAAVGLSWVGDKGFMGASYRGLDMLYGIPGGDEPVQIDARQRRIDVDGAWTQPFGPFTGVHVRAGRADYEHMEMEGSEIGTTFRSDSWEGRLEMLHDIGDRTSGTAGLQFANREQEAIGDEAFLPPTETAAAAAFLIEEIRTRRFRYKLGARYEDQSVDCRPAAGDACLGAAPGMGVRRSFDGISGSFGLVWAPQEAYSVAVSLARTEGIPSAEQLFSDGPHLATNSFEIGDPDLGKVTSLGLDVSLRKQTGRITGEFNLFLNRFEEFIFERATGEIMDGLPVFRFSQADAEFVGAELHGDVALWHVDPHHLSLEISGDYVRAELRDSGEPLPRIPPLRLAAGLQYQGKRFWGGAEVRYVAEQDRVAGLETPTDAYTFLNANFGVRFFAGGMVQELLLTGRNLTNAEARNHVSRLKDVVLLPGSALTLGYRLMF